MKNITYTAIAVTLLAIAMPASAVIDHNRIPMPRDVENAPTWCWTYVGIPCPTEEEPEKICYGFLSNPQRPHGCTIEEPPAYDWVVVGFSEPNSEDTDNDTDNNDMDICPTMPANFPVPLDHETYGCPDKYIEPFATSTTRDILEAWDADSDGVADWFDVCDDEQGTANTLGCRRLPKQFCEAINRPPESVITGDLGSGRQFKYYIYHDEEGTGAVYGMGARAHIEAVRICATQPCE